MSKLADDYPRDRDTSSQYGVTQDNQSVPTVQEKPKRSRRHLYSAIRQWGASFVISLSYLIVGTCLGWPSPVLYEMRETGEPINLTTSSSSLMVSLFYAGNIFMPIPSGFLIDLMGRKYTLMALSILPLGTWILTYLTTHEAFLHVARTLAGLWGGLVLTAVPLYIGELAEPRMRGKMSSLAQLQTNLGVLLAYVVGPPVSYWTFAIICGTIPLLFVLCLCFVPESPSWYVMQGKYTKAEKSLSWFRGKDQRSKRISSSHSVTDEEADLVKAIHSDFQKPSNVMSLIRSKGNRKALIIVEVLAICQRFSGISALMAYGSITLPDKNVWILTPNDCVIALAIGWMIGIGTSVILVDKVGRRPLLMISCAGSGISMATACAWFLYNETTDDDSAHWLPFIALFTYGCFFNIGLGPLATTIQGEMFPSQLKAIASGITVIVLSFSSFIVNGSYLHIAKGAGMFVNYLIFTATCFGCLIFVWTTVIETKGKTLHEIQHELAAL